MRRLSSCTNSHTIVVGRGIDCDFVATNVQSKNGQLRFSIEDVEFRVPAWGRQQVDEVLTACAVAQCFGIPLTKTASILAQSRGVATNHIIETKTGLIIDRSGVPSFQAVIAGLDELRESTSPSRRVAIVGQGMTDDDDRNCQWLGESLVTRAGVNLLIGCGPSSKVVLQAAGEAGLPPEHAVWCNDTKELQQLTSSLIQSDDAVLAIAGDQRIVDWLLNHMSPSRNEEVEILCATNGNHNPFKVQPLVSDLREFDTTHPPG